MRATIEPGTTTIVTCATEDVYNLEVDPRVELATTVTIYEFPARNVYGESANRASFFDKLTKGNGVPNKLKPSLKDNEL